MVVILTAVAVAIMVFLVVAPILGFVNREQASLKFTPVFLIAGISLSVVRIAAYWTLVYMNRTAQRDIMAMPFALLIPEGSLVPESDSLTTARAVLFSALLLIDSYVWAGVLAWSMNRRKVG